MSGAILPDDVVSRVLLDPKDFAPDLPKRLKLTDHFMFLEKHEYKISVNCHRLVEAMPDDIHTFGLTKESIVNKNKKPDAAEQTYRGYMESEVKTIEDVEDAAELHHLEVISSPVKDDPQLPDNPAHCDITLIVDEGTKPKKAVYQRFAQILGDVFGPDWVAYERAKAE